MPYGDDLHGAAQGRYMQLQEQFNDYKETVNVTAYVEKLDDTEFTFSIKRFGVTICRDLNPTLPTFDSTSRACWVSRIATVLADRQTLKPQRKVNVQSTLGVTLQSYLL